MAADLNAGVMEGEVARREDEATALEAVEMRVRRHQAWKAKRKLSEQQELEEIGHLGKVKRESTMRLLARHMLHKAANGPLEKPNTERRKRRRSRGLKSSGGVASAERVRTERGEKWVVGETGSALDYRESQKEELESLRGMKLVQAHLANRDTRKRAMRMFNQRIYMKPAQVPSHKGSSILVTGYQEAANSQKLLRQQSQVVIDNFFNIPRRNKRVLDKLSSEQVKQISDTELHKTRSKKLTHEAKLPELKGDDLADAPEESKGARRRLKGKLKRGQAALKKAVSRQPSEIEGSHPQEEEVDHHHQQRAHRRIKLTSKNITRNTSAAKGDNKERKLNSKPTHSILNGGNEEDVETERSTILNGRDEEVEQLETERSQRSGHKWRWHRPGKKPTGSWRHEERDARDGKLKANTAEGDFLAALPAQGTKLSSSVGDTFPFSATSDKKEVHWEESTDGGGEAIPTVELLSAQLSLDQVTMESFPRERSLAVVQTQYNMTTVLSGSPPQPPSGPTLLPPPPPPHPPLGPPPLGLPPHTSSGPPPPPPPPVHTQMEKTAAYSITTLYQYTSEEKTQEVENDIIPNLNTKFRQESFLKPQKLQQESFEAPDSNRYSSTTTAPTPSEEEIEYQTSSMSHRQSISSVASTTSTSTAPDHCSPEPPLDRIDDNEPDTFELSSSKDSQFGTSSTKSSSFDSDPPTGDSSGRYRRFFSSPQMSFVASESDLQHIASLHTLHTGTPHGYYQDANPFQVEFSEALKGVELGGTTDEEGLTDQSEVLEELPPHLLEDPSFRDYVSKLGRIPKKSDYISYKIAMIGDQIDQKYDQQLNQALDTIIYEVMKENVSWQSFSKVSQKLMLQGQHMQDGILMIPCFARRLLECVPNMRDTIANYTQMVMDNYATDLILNVGGWAPLMAHYSQTEAQSDYDDWDDFMAQLHQDEVVDATSPMGYDLFTPDPKYAQVSLATASELLHPPNQIAHSLPRTIDPPIWSLPTDLPCHKTNFNDHLFPHQLTSEPDHLPPTSQIRKSRSIEVLVCEEGPEHFEHNKGVVPPKLVRLTSRRHSFSRGISNEPEFLARGSSPIPVYKPQDRPGSEFEGENGTAANVISVGQPVSEHSVMVEVGISEVHQNSFFIFHSRSSSLESSTTIRIITGEEELSQPDDSPSLPTRFRRQHGHSRSSSLNSTIHPGVMTTEDTHAHHRTDSHSSNEIWDMNLDSPVEKTQSSENNGFHGNGVAQPPHRGRRLSEVMLENLAHAAPLLTHTIGAVVAIICAQKK